VLHNLGGPHSRAMTVFFLARKVRQLVPTVCHS
jgi:hypothetical protein